MRHRPAEETAGVDALPIISVLSFFIGAVVAFMGASLLETFGASVFTVDLVGIAVLREFGVIITFKYPIKDSDKFIPVATTRIETMLGDTGIAVSPTDNRYKEFIGKEVS